MHKRFDDIFSAIMLAAAVAVVLAGAWCMSHSIKQVGAEREAIPVADLHIEESHEESCSPLPTTTPAPDPYNPEIPLSPELQAVLSDACEEHDVPVALALGLIEVESQFQVDAISSEGCYGLMQLNPKYFPADLSQEDNLWAGIKYLGGLLVKYGDTEAALTVYNAGHDTGSREYAGDVLEAAQRWEDYTTP